MTVSTRCSPGLMAGARTTPASACALHLLARTHCSQRLILICGRRSHVGFCVAAGGRGTLSLHGGRHEAVSKSSSRTVRGSPGTPCGDACRRRPARPPAKGSGTAAASASLTWTRRHPGRPCRHRQPRSSTGSSRTASRSSSSTPTPATARCSSTQSCSSPTSDASSTRQSPSPEVISCRRWRRR